ncbi:MAG: GMC family oxidoreductase [Gemmatimonadota bacterium]|jgi:choline dehydrogenase-like flavoprotein|nr:GMC family oxidoreductase [Gemmatimonadota bacterium]
MSGSAEPRYDAIVVGSGFGGCLAALGLIEAGMSVLMLERGGRVERSAANWGDEGAFVLTPHYTHESDYQLRSRRGWKPQGITACVGGPSIFYGGASFRFREADFSPPRELIGDSGAEWPISYSELEPFYSQVEELLHIAGEAGVDPTEPFRSRPFPAKPMPLAGPSPRIEEAGRALGLRPFRIPMAIDGAICRSCTTCDAFACAVSAKNDLATRLIPALIGMGMELRPGMVVSRLGEHGGRIGTVEAVDTATGEHTIFRSDRVVLAAGAIATPHLLLASRLERQNPGAEVVGRYLMRHCNAMMYGFFPRPTNPRDEHHKQLAFHDFYFGDEGRPGGLEKLGNIQQVMAPPTSLIRAMLPAVVGRPAAVLLRNLTGLLAVAEDQPRHGNGVTLGPGSPDRFGLPPARIEHQYTRRDLAARRALLTRAREILRRAGALFTVTYNVTTFSHAVGTVRMGEDPRRSALDPDCRFRGISNLWVTDGSVFPTSGGVNPSLTIAANALRVGRLIGAEG